MLISGPMMSKAREGYTEAAEAFDKATELGDLDKYEAEAYNMRGTFRYRVSRANRPRWRTITGTLTAFLHGPRSVFVSAVDRLCLML